MPLNVLDLILIIPLLLWARQGYKKGLIISVASFAALVLGLYVAFFFSDITAMKLQEHFTIDKEYLTLIAFLVTFVVVVIVVVVIGNILQKFIDVLMLGFLNKAAGIVFGILKGALYLSILIFVINYFDTGKRVIKQEYRDGSVLYDPIASFGPMLYSQLNLEEVEIDLPGKEELIDEVY